MPLSWHFFDLLRSISLRTKRPATVLCPKQEKGRHRFPNGDPCIYPVIEAKKLDRSKFFNGFFLQFEISIRNFKLENYKFEKNSFSKLHNSQLQDDQSGDK